MGILRSVSGVLLLAVALLLRSPDLFADACVWDGTSNDWNSAHWSSCGGAGFPGSGDTATISSGTVHLTASQAAGGLTFSGGTIDGAGTLTISSGAMAWSGGGMSGTGSTVIAAGATLTIGGGVGLSRTLTVNGTGNWTAGRIDTSGAAAINNNGTFTTTTDNGIENFGGSQAFNNAGTFTKSTATGASYCNIPFNNTGTVTISSGTFNLNGGGTSTGTFSAAAGATLNFNGGTHDVTLAGGKSISGAGTIGYTGGATTTIDGAGTYNVTGTSNVTGGTVNLNLASGAGNWTQSGGTLSGSGTVTVPSGKSYTWSGGGMSGTGSTVIAAGATLTIGGGVGLSRTLTVNGTGNWTAGRIDTSGAAAINNNGTFTTTTDNGIENFGGSQAFNNAGTFTKSTATGASYCNIPFNNTGTVTISSGTFNLNGGGTSTGTFSAAAGATLNFNGGTHDVTLAGGKSISGAGTIGYTGGATTTIDGAGTYNVTGTSNVTGGTVNLNLASGAGNWTQSGGTLSGSGTVTVPSGKSYTWSGGGMSGTGSTVIAAGATLTIGGGVGLSRTLTVNGTGNWTAGRIDTSGAAAINNNGTFTTTTDNGIENFGGSQAFNNAGTFTKSTATGASYCNIPFNNTGTVTISSGTFNLNGGGTSTGTFSAAAGATLNFNGGTHDVTLAGGKSISGAGTIGYTGGATTTIDGAGTYNVTGTSNVTGGTVNLNLASGAGNWTQSGGTLSGSGTVTVPSGKSYTWSGGGMSGTGSTVIAAGAALTIGGGVGLSRAVTVNGTGNWTAGRIDTSGAAAINNNGTFTTTTDNGIENFGGSQAFNNAGTFTKSTATGNSYSNIPFNNTGTFNASSGNFAFAAFTQTAGTAILNGGSISTTTTLNIQGGTLKGTGTITGNVSNGGTVAPGLSPGILNVVGNYSQTAAGTLAIELSGTTVGTQYDQLNVTGTVALAGTLAVTPGFTPAEGDTFTILANDATDAISGFFTGLPETAVVIVGANTFRITYLGDTGNDIVLKAGPAVAAVSIAVDPAAGAGSDGNSVLEPGETVAIKPSWKNVGTLGVVFSTAASNFTGPAGATYTIVDGAANYGTIGAGATADCGSNCLSLFVTDPASRPTTHWDATFVETPATSDPPKVWTLHLGDSFTDVPRSQLFYRRIETLVHTAITAGCGVGKYCPNDPVNRAQMAIFIAKGIAGGGPNVPVSGSFNAQPYNCVNGGSSLFTDVTPTDIFCKHVHYMAVQNVTLGCGGGQYCPAGNISRSDMAIFVAKAIVAPQGGPGVPETYGPDPVTGFSYSCVPGSPNLHFTDISTSDSFCKHVHYLWARNIVSGCSATTYCPTLGVTRDQMARFLGNAFNLVLYAP